MAREPYNYTRSISYLHRRRAPMTKRLCNAATPLFKLDTVQIVLKSPDVKKPEASENCVAAPVYFFTLLYDELCERIGTGGLHTCRDCARCKRCTHSPRAVHSTRCDNRCENPKSAPPQPAQHRCQHASCVARRTTTTRPFNHVIESSGVSIPTGSARCAPNTLQVKFLLLVEHTLIPRKLISSARVCVHVCVCVCVFVFLFVCSASPEKNSDSLVERSSTCLCILKRCVHMRVIWQGTCCRHHRDHHRVKSHDDLYAYVHICVYVFVYLHTHIHICVHV